ncbi:MAG: hypothetical protein N3I35_06545 [Clostridia bacterium]|nr:hypothetical protein [Clostridia bacterium]
MGINCDTKKVDETLKQIIEDKLSLNLNGFSDDMADQDLLGSHFRLKASELLFIFFEIERVFNVKIPERDIKEGNFNTLSKIKNIILNQIKVK